MTNMEPLKKPQSAYFIFSNAMRQSIKEELLKEKEKVSMGEVAKAIGARWKALGEEERAAYQEMAAAEKEAYAKALEERGDVAECEGTVADDAGAGNGEETKEGKRTAAAHSMLPLSMVKKLATSDEDVKRVSGDALKLITEATGLFLGSLAAASMEVALSKKKKNFKLEDMIEAAKKDSRLVDMGLGSAFEGLKSVRAGAGQGTGSGEVQRKRPAGEQDVGGKQGKRHTAAAAKGSIASFFSSAPGREGGVGDSA
jgi:histone H3/H4